MTTLLVLDSLFRQHAVPRGHPERPERLEAVEAALSIPLFDRLKREAATLAPLEAAELAHPRAFVQSVAKARPAQDFHFFDADTPMSPASLDVALHAVGSGMRAVDAVFGKEVANAFVACRPPGHHAEKTKAMGFCFFNSIAIAARHAQRRHGAERIAIIDFDVHHGNGTQDIFWDDKSVLFCSTHEMPLYPGTGAASERGEHNTIVNAPLRAGDDGSVFARAFRESILPRVRDHAPDMILISAGFDAHKRDPLANLRLEENDFAFATEALMEIAAKRCEGRIVSMLEGGYDLQGLAGSLATHVHTLMGA